MTRFGATWTRAAFYVMTFRASGLPGVTRHYRLKDPLVGFNPFSPLLLQNRKLDVGRRESEERFKTDLDWTEDVSLYLLSNRGSTILKHLGIHCLLRSWNLRKINIFTACPNIGA